MTVIFDTLPSGRRTPERGIEINKRLASAGLIATGAKRVLAIGQRAATGTVAAGVLKEVYSDADGKDYFGRGTILANMIEACFKQHPSIRLEAIGLADADAAVAASGDITFSGTCTKAGTLRLWIGNRYIDILVDVDDDGEAVVDALVAAESPSLADMPATIAKDGVTAEKLNITARNKGPCGNDIYIAAEILTCEGVSAAVTAMASGATYPTTLQTILDTVAPEHYNIIIVGGIEDATELGRLEDHMDLVGGPLEMRGGYCVYGTTGTIASATTLVDNFATSFRFVPCTCEGVKTAPWELAALYGAALASNTDVAMPMNGVELKGLDIPEAADRYTKTEIEAMLWAGVGPIVLGAGNKMRIVRTITSLQETEAGADDDSILDAQTLEVLEWLRYQLNTMFTTKFSRAKFYDDENDGMLDVVRNEVINILRAAASPSIRYLHQVEDNLDGVLAERDATDQVQMNVRVPAVVVPGLHKIYSRVDYLKTTLG